MPTTVLDPGKIYHPLRLVCKFRIDPELALETGLHHGASIGKMLELYPYDQLKHKALSEAKTFMGHMRRQGYIPQQAESEMELWGPYREKVDMSKGADLVNFEEGNPLIPQGHWGSAAHGVSKADSRDPRVLNKRELLDSPDWRHGVVFLIRGKFLATHWKESDSDGTLIV